MLKMQGCNLQQKKTQKSAKFLLASEDCYGIFNKTCVQPMKIIGSERCTPKQNYHSNYKLFPEINFVLKKEDSGIHLLLCPSRGIIPQMIGWWT